MTTTTTTTTNTKCVNQIGANLQYINYLHIYSSFYLETGRINFVFFVLLTIIIYLFILVLIVVQI